MGKNLFNKLWDLHRVAELPTGQDQLFVGLHLIHEVTSPQAFAMLKERGISVLHPERTFGTVDHIIPTHTRKRPFADELAENMMVAIEENTKEHNIAFFGPDSEFQGIVHVVGPGLGLTQPGMIIACGDSHTSTHGAFGAIAFGIGTSQIRDVLATQTLAMNRLKVRQIKFVGRRGKNIFAKDLVLKLMADLGVKAGAGYAYEYCGDAISSLTMEERMTLCNMSIEGGARVGYINPDETTFAYVKGKKYAPADEHFDRAVAFWKSIASDADASFDDTVEINIENISPMVTWGITPGQACEVDTPIPTSADVAEPEMQTYKRALEHMGFREGQVMEGTKIDVAFIGSCTNGRLSDLREAAAIAKGNKVSSSVKALVVPGSIQVQHAAEAEGLDEIFREAGFEWRHAGCSMCLAMNPDKLSGRQLSASSSNRNFIGRQGAPLGRTMLMSPAMVAAAACAGEIVNIQK